METQTAARSRAGAFAIEILSAVAPKVKARHAANPLAGLRA